MAPFRGHRQVSLLLCALALLPTDLGVLGQGHGHSGPSWGYSGAGAPANWPSIVKTCGLQRQSPIDVITNSAKPANFKPFKFTNYSLAPKSYTVKNNGHSAVVGLDIAPKVMDGGLPGEYTFAQFHFHWGGDSSKGSEHTINGKSFPLEMHIVNFKTEYGSLGGSVDKGDGLAVLGVMWEIQSNDNPNIQPIIEALSSVTNSGGAAAEVNQKNPLESLLPSTDVFFRYLGSLTTPTCNEAVVWTLFQEPMGISEKQMSVFRSLKYTSGSPLVDNFRPPQPLNGREIQVRSTGGSGGGGGMGGGGGGGSSSFTCSTVDVDCQDCPRQPSCPVCSCNCAKHPDCP